MTTPGPSIAQLDATLAPVRHLLLDFDGVICRLYGPGAQAETVSSLRELLAKPLSGFTGAVPQADDPAAFLCLSGANSALGVVLEGELADREFSAAATARPAGFAADLIASIRESGRTVTVVTSCATRAVNAFLDRAGLATLTESVVARQPGMPASAAPADLLARCRRRIRTDPGTCAVVSARPDLLDAASTARMPAIRYEAAPGQAATPAGRPPAAVTGLDQLVLWFRARPLRDNVS